MIRNFRKRIRLLRRVLQAHRDYVGGRGRTLKALAFLAPRVGRTRRTICFLPTKPGPEYMIRHVCALLGYRTVASMDEPSDLVVKWVDDTFPSPSHTLRALATKGRVVNLGVTDISKTRIGRLMEEVFGYSATVDPTSYRGVAIKKSNLNAMDMEEIVECPLSMAEVDGGAIYQEILGESPDGRIVEHRIACIDGRPVAAVERLRDPERRFEFESSTLSVARLSDVMDPEELRLVGKFTRRIGLDYGDLDTMRDGQGRLHVLDVNPTPWNQMIGDDPTPAGPALLDMARALERMVEESSGRWLKPRTMSVADGQNPHGGARAGTRAEAAHGA